MSTLRDQILNSDDRGSEVVDIPEWGVKIEVRARTVGEQFDLIDSVRRADGELDRKLLAVETVIACCFDPDTGERVFDPADRDTLLGKSSQAFGRLLEAANRAAGLEEEAVVVSSLDTAGSSTA